MSETIEKRLADLGIVLPVPGAPAANYVPTVISGKQLYVSGQLPFVDGKLPSTGLVGRDVDLATARDAARLCGINVLAQAKVGLGGDLGRIVRAVKLTVFVASAQDFTEQHLVANGASDVIVAVLGEPGRHARSAIGMASLPLNTPVEVEAIFEIA
jgi:enamine deaminase RidA (YjgF/YER057c/UK114 family)